MRTDVSRLQEAVRALGADAWAIYDFRGTNDLGWTLLDVDPQAHCTRRWMVVIPAHGRCTKIVHRMEHAPLAHLAMTEQQYSTRAEWEQAVRETLAPYQNVAMEYSPNGAIPVVSKVDAGTVELVRGLGHVVVSSANIVQRFTSVLTSGQLAGAAVAAGQVREAIMSGFDLVRQKLLAEEPVTEYDVQKHIMEQMRRQNLVWDGDPIVATGVNASSPHYAPGPVRSSPIERDMVVLIDCWAKHASAGSVYADLTFVGYTADVVPSDVESTFGVIVRARDAALGLVRERFAAGAVIAGYEVDDACRAVVQAAGLTSNFIHRTGHSITTEVHGSGVNMDNYETHDDRHLLPGTTFSIEPGLYFADSLGLRTEIDVVVNADGTVNVPSAPLQMHMLPLLAEAWTA